jgi:hypothetical protein
MVSNSPQEFVEKRFVTPAKAGVQIIRTNEISNMLDSGLRRNDGREHFSDFSNKLLDFPPLGALGVLAVKI